LSGSALKEQRLFAAVLFRQHSARGAGSVKKSLIAEAEAARVKAMAEKGGAAAAVSALIAKLAGMWRDKVDQHNTGTPAYERIERIIVERAPAEERLLPSPDEVAIEAEPDFEEQPAVGSTSNPSKHRSL
jgi:hypothetical protein